MKYLGLKVKVCPLCTALYGNESHVGSGICQLFQELRKHLANSETRTSDNEQSAPHEARRRQDISS
jgi:hypothetical protein